jgi:FkbM family methyltransferase
MFESIRGHTVYAAALGREAVIVDLGANRGEFSRQIQARVGGRCYLVEANPSLALTLENEGRFPVWKCAVGAADGVVAFHIANNDEASSMLELTDGSVYGGGVRETVEVRTKSLETLLSEIGCGQVDLLKMDIEGAEIAVLQSAPALVLRRIGQVTAEFHSDPEFGFQIRDEVESVILRMRQLGFIFLDFSYGTRRDVLFVNRAVHHVSWLRELLWRFRCSPPRWVQACWNSLPSSLKTRLRASLNSATGIDRDH